MRSKHCDLVYQYDPERSLLGVEHIEVPARPMNLTALIYDGEGFFKAYATRHGTRAMLHFDTGAQLLNHWASSRRIAPDVPEPTTRQRLTQRPVPYSARPGRR